MAKEKIYTKKLTYSGGGVCTLTFFALLLSAASTMTELIATKLYNALFGREIESFFVSFRNGFDMQAFFSIYDKAVTMTVFTLILFIWACCSLRKKRMGREFPVIAAILPIFICVTPVLDLYNYIAVDNAFNNFSNAGDGDKFRTAINLSVYLLPVLSGVLTLSAGLLAAGRISAEEFTAVVPVVTAEQWQAAGQGYAPEMPTAQGFMQNQPTTQEFMPNQPTAQEFMPNQPTAQDFMPNQSTAQEFMPEKPADTQQFNGMTGVNPPVEPAMAAASAYTNSEQPIEQSTAFEQTEASPDTEDSSKSCPFCGAPIEDGDKFCIECGGSLV